MKPWASITLLIAVMGLVIYGFAWLLSKVLSPKPYKDEVTDEIVDDGAGLDQRVWKQYRPTDWHLDANGKVVVDGEETMFVNN